MPEPSRKERKVTAREKKTPGKGGAKKLKLKRETIRDLGAKQASKGVKGGWGLPTVGCKTADCPIKPTMCSVCAVLL